MNRLVELHICKCDFICITKINIRKNPKTNAPKLIVIQLLTLLLMFYTQYFLHTNTYIVNNNKFIAHSTKK